MTRSEMCRLTAIPLFLVAACVRLLAGCSSSLTVEEACADYAHNTHAWVTNCAGVAPPPDLATQISRETQSCTLASSAPGSQVGAAYWESCAVQAGTDDCAGYQCATYPPGTLKTGAPCLATVQCESLWCGGALVVGPDGVTSANAIQCGTCAKRLAVGKPCDVTKDACDVGLSCFGGVCRTQGQQGEACAVWADCAHPSVCLSNGFCGTVLPDGAPCGNSNDCATATGCDVTTKVCMAAQYAPAGGGCDGEVHRCVVGDCNHATGTCPALLADGAACDPADASTVCSSYALCFRGRCTIADPAECK